MLLECFKYKYIVGIWEWQLFVVWFPADKFLETCVYGLKDIQCWSDVTDGWLWKLWQIQPTREQSILTMVTHNILYVQVVLDFQWVCPMKTKSLYVYTYIQTLTHIYTKAYAESTIYT